MIVKDSVRSWIVLFVVTFTMFLEVGIMKAFSVLLPSLKEQLNTSTWVVGSSIAIITGFGYSFGILAGAFLKMFSPRRCVMASGCICSVGLIVCSIANTSSVLLVGLLLTGFILVQETFVLGIIPDYFERYYEFAVGIYSTGTALAILSFPVLTQELLDTYGWKGTLILLSGIMFHSVIGGTLLRPGTVRNEDTVLETKPIITSEKQGLVGKLGLHLWKRMDFITRCIIPALVSGYVLAGWFIYMVSFVMSKNTSIKAATVVVTNGGIGMLIVRIGLFLLHKIMTYKQLLYLSSLLMAVFFSLMSISSGLIALNILSILFGAAIGVFGAETYISAKMNTHESEYYNAISWMHLAHGLTSVLSGFITGYLYDMTGSFTVSFNILAGASLVTALSVGLGDIVHVYKMKCEKWTNI